MEGRPDIEGRPMRGILEWPTKAEGRVRQIADGLVEQPDDPFVPLKLGEQP